MSLCQYIKTAFALSGFLMIFAASGSAATFSLDVNGMTEEYGVESVTFWLDVDQFAYENFQLGDAVPTNGFLGWEIAKNDVTSDGIYKIDLYDKDGLFVNNENHLTNGTVFTFDYSGTINGLNTIIFGDAEGNNLFANNALWEGVSLTANGVDVSASPVPIPSSLLLFGCGLAGLVGFKRKQK